MSAEGLLRFDLLFEVGNDWKMVGDGQSVTWQKGLKILAIGFLIVISARLYI